MKRFAIVLAAALLAACETEPVRQVQAFFQPSKGYSTLNVGLKQYEDGQYAESLKNLQSAIQQGLTNSEKVNAHKHVAFIHCASNRRGACRDEFRKALAVDPSMDLAPEEADHPVWGPIFRSVKAGR